MKSVLFSVFLFTSASFLSFKCNASELPQVIPPIVSAGDEVAILIVPGAYINAAMYQPLGEALQRETSLKLWIGLVGPFATDLPNPSQCAKNIEEVLGMMRQMGMSTDVLFLAGHSLGGVVMQTWAWDNQSNVTGLILMGSELVMYNLTEAPLPVMHISGDLDGLETVAETAYVYKELQSMVSLDPENKIPFAVTVLQDVNHMQFASGDVPLAVRLNDILSPISQEEAQALIAVHIMAYATAISRLPPAELQASIDVITQDYADTGAMMQPFFTNYYLTDGGTFSEWSQIGQVIISSIAEEDSGALSVNDTILSMEELVESKPSVELIGDTAYVNTYTHISYENDLSVDDEVSAKEIAVKFKSREAMMQVLEPLGISFNGNTSCRQINEDGLSVVLDSATDVQRNRYENRSKRIYFTEDDEMSTGSGWVYTGISYKESDTALNVTSVSLHTSVNAGFGLGGMHYCKLMPPARMIEYIAIFSLRGTSP